MTFNDSETSAKRYTLRPTFTPLPQAKGAQKNKVADSKTSARATAARIDSNPAPDLPNSVIRAANEDDDLYDPYSDVKSSRIRKGPLAISPQLTII